METSLTFGPVPSRRLGRSLGINNIPPKTCTYSCIYCQLGRTINLTIQRRAFYDPETLVVEVPRRVNNVLREGGAVDYVTFVPDGEPTLDINIGKEIHSLKAVGLRVAVITNASLLWMEEVRNDLMEADWVSLKVDSVRPSTWRRVDRPHKELYLDKILEGLEIFSRDYRGELNTETMLVEGVNDSPDEVGAVASYLRKLGPIKAYISVPTRPPAEPWVNPPSEDTVNTAYQIFAEAGIKAELLIQYEGSEFTAAGSVKDEIAGIAAVHPLRREAVQKILDKAGEGWEVVDELLREGVLQEVDYRGIKFYVRRFGRASTARHS